MSNSDGATSDEQFVLLTRDQARTLTDEIKTNLQRDWDLICRAYTARADLALGYASWDAYCGTEFNSLYLRVPREERDGVVVSLRQRGLSTRAIAAATGLSKSTVGRVPDGTRGDLTEDSPGQTDRVAVALERASRVRHEAKPSLQERIESGELTPRPKKTKADQVRDWWADVEAPERSTGLDGKSYPAKKQPKSDNVVVDFPAQKGKGQPKPGRRPPLPDQYAAAVLSAERAIQRLVTITEDDRYEGHRKRLKETHLAQVQRMTTTMFAVQTHLENPKCGAL